MPLLQTSYSDYVTDTSGNAVAGATVLLYAAATFAGGVRPTAPPSLPPQATATTDASGLFRVTGLPPDDYHLLVQYTPPGGLPQSLWRYDVPVIPAAVAERAAQHNQGALLPRTLAKLLSGQPVTIVCLGDGVTVGYNATGTVSGGWVARLATRLATAYPAATVLRYDPSGYATTLDAAIPGWTTVSVQTGSGGAAIGVVNAGVTGDTVLRALRRLGNLTAPTWSPPPDAYVVALGLGEMGADPTRAATAADLAGHLSGLVEVLRADGAECALCTPHAGPAPTLGGTLDDYASAVRSVAAAGACALVDLRTLWQDHSAAGATNDGYGSWLATANGDHSSPTDDGHAAIGDAVFRLFDAASALPLALPGATGSAFERVLLTSAAPTVLTFTGAWTATPSLHAASGQLLQTSTPGDTLTFAARFCDLSMLCGRWKDGGQVQVTVDGSIVGTVDLYRANPVSIADTTVVGAIAPRERVPLASGLADAVHAVTLTLRATTDAASGGTVWRVDALELLRLRRAGQGVESAAPLVTVQSGQLVLALGGAATAAGAVAFSPVFAHGAPVVVVSPVYAGNGYAAAVSGVSAAGCQVYVFRRDGQVAAEAVPVNWLAVG